MKRFAAQYVIDGTGQLLKRAIITTDDDGLISNIEDTGGDLKELSHTAFYNGIIIPGMVNCHCHLELSAMKNTISPHKGLADFIREIREKRESTQEQSSTAISEADRQMYNEGIIACGDICNNDSSFAYKDDSGINYVNFLEVFGINPLRAQKRIDEVLALYEQATNYKTPSFIVPHSLYSMSVSLLKLLSEYTENNDITSIHYLESQQERELLSSLEGGLMDSYSAMGIGPEDLYDRVTDHQSGIKKYLPEKGNLIMVHNTFAGRDDISSLSRRENCFWCLCPGSNLYIENHLPPLDLLRENKALIVLGTDSLASNTSLSILEELKILNHHFSSVPLQEMIQWACLNGARALNLHHELGSIEIGKKPGLVLLEDVDLEKIRLKPESRCRRLI